MIQSNLFNEISVNNNTATDSHESKPCQSLNEIWRLHFAKKAFFFESYFGTI